MANCVPFLKVLVEAADQAQRDRMTLAAMSRLLKFVEEEISKFTDPALAKAVEVLQTSIKKRQSWATGGLMNGA